MLAPKQRFCDAVAEEREATRVDVTPEVAGAPLFAGISETEIAGILGAFDEQSFNTGHRITLEGLRGRDFYVIRQGRARVDVDGFTVAQLGPGDFFGEVAVLIGGSRSATVSAETPLRCLVLSNDGLEDLLARHPRLGLNMLREVLARFEQVNRRPPYTIRLAGH